jgi:sulfofructose kinase
LKRSLAVRIPFTIPAAGARPFDVAAFGLNSIDLVAVVAEYPVVNSKQRLQRVARLPGGQMATAIATCAKLGWRARYIGRFGGDDLGAMSRDSLTREGVDTSASEIVAGATNQFAVILVDGRTGERTVLWDRHPSLNMQPADVPREAVTSGRLLIVDCHQTAAAAQAARYARAAGIPTIIDVEKVRPGIGDLLQNIDVIIAAEEFPTALTGHEQLGEALPMIAREFGASIVCVTLGAHGSLAWCNGREIVTPAFPVDCIDSTGAGDCFRGGFAAACLRMPNGEVEDALGYANAVAALNCRALGSRGGLPTPEEVDQLMLARPHI